MHWFLRGLLKEWGLEMHHLNSSGVLHIAGFVTVCEAFLGMEPHVDFFQWMFSGRALLEGKLFYDHGPTRLSPSSPSTSAGLDILRTGSYAGFSMSGA